MRESRHRGTCRGWTGPSLPSLRAQVPDRRTRPPIDLHRHGLRAWALDHRGTAWRAAACDPPPALCPRPLRQLRAPVPPVVCFVDPSSPFPDLEQGPFPDLEQDDRWTGRWRSRLARRWKCRRAIWRCRTRARGLRPPWLPTTGSIDSRRCGAWHRRCREDRKPSHRSERRRACRSEGEKEKRRKRASKRRKRRRGGTGAPSRGAVLSAARPAGRLRDLAPAGHDGPGPAPRMVSTTRSTSSGLPRPLHATCWSGRTTTSGAP